MLSSRVAAGPKEGGGPVAGGSTIQWVLGNDGTDPWPEETTLRLVAGPALTCHSVKVPPLSPEQTVVVELEVSPVKALAEVSYVLVAPGGRPFGEIMTAEVVPEALSAAALQKPLCALLTSPMDRAPEGGTRAKPGSVQRLEWTLANPGPAPWPADASIRLLHSTLDRGQVPADIALPEVAPGMTVHVEVSARVPRRAGHFKVMWSVTSPTQPDFGEVLLAEFAVSCSGPDKPSRALKAPRGTKPSGKEAEKPRDPPRYSVEVFNKYDALQPESAEADPEPEEPKEALPAALHPRASPRQCKKAAAGLCVTRDAWVFAEDALEASRASTEAQCKAAVRSPAPPRARLQSQTRRSSFWAVLPLLTGLFLGPSVCLGSSTERGVVGSCGGTECVALLEASETNIRVEGTVALIEMIQTFRGSNSHGGLAMADASFVVPVNDASVVTGFAADIGGKVLRGAVKERRRAQRIYREHVEAGCPAALGQQGASRQQQPRDARDLFRISIGKLPANARAQVNLSMVQELAVEDGKSCSGDASAAVRLLVPNAAPSRYAPSGVRGAGAAAEVLEASGRQLPQSFAVSAEIYGEVQSASSPSHAGLVSVRWRGPEDDAREPAARIAMEFSGANVTEDAVRTDFVLHVAFGAPGDRGAAAEARRLEVSLLQPRVRLERHPVYATWAAVAEFVPRFDFEPEAAVELVFLVDRSGSMGWTGGGIRTGSPKVLAARSALQHFVRSAPVGAMFNVVSFGSRFEALFRAGPRELGEETFREALELAETLEPNFGGTEILAPLRSILSQPQLEGHPRRIFVLTDGEVWNQAEVLDLVEERCGSVAPSCQLFALGIGSGASTALVEGLARAGRGAARFVAEGEEDALEERVVQMLAAALQPSFSNVSVAWPSGPPASRRHEGAVVPLLGRRRLQRVEASTSTSSAPPQGEPSAAEPAPVPPAGEEAAAGLFEASARPASAALRRSSMGAAEEAEAKRHEEDIERFVSQGGVVTGPLQAPQPAPPILLGHRWAVYALLGHLRDEDLPTEIGIQAVRNGRSLTLRARVTSRGDGAALHALAARHLVNGLEGKKAQHQTVPLPGEDDRRWQVAALGVAYGLATAHTSWLAVGELPQEPSQAQQSGSAEQQAMGKPGASLSVLDFVQLGSSMSLRSFSRLGASMAVYGMARLGSSLAVLDFCHLGASLALRSFARLGSSIAVVGMAHLGSSVAVASMARLGSTHSAPAAPAPADASRQPAAAAASAPSWPGAPVAFVVAWRPGEASWSVPLLPVWRAADVGSGGCLAAWSNSSRWGRRDREGGSPLQALAVGGLRLSLLPARGVVPDPAGATLPGGSASEEDALAAAAAAIAKGGHFLLDADCKLSVGDGGPLVAQLRLASLAVEPSEEKALERLLLDAGGNASDALAGAWSWEQACAMLPPEAYKDVLAAQRFDGSFAWPEAFLRRLGWVGAGGSGASAAEVLPPGLFKHLPVAESLLASGTVIGAWRRCFGGMRQKWALLERKALAKLQAATLGAEGAVALAESLVLAPALAVAAARQGAPPPA